jgi:serine/threonine protein kinase
MGTVWLAFDERLKEPVALKFLSGRIRGNPAALDAMRRETSRSHSLSHQNIVRIHDLYEFENEPPFISMEYVDGLNLHDLAREEPNRAFAWRKVLPWIPQLCGALNYAHSRGVIHRDLKPANLMLDRDGELRLADFGLATAATESSQEREGQISGTPAYMSPQQLCGTPADFTDDIYSLGACVFELLAGVPVFKGGGGRRQADPI